MTDSFELLTGGITRIYKSIQKIKRVQMNTLGLKGTHVMCIHYLYVHPEGLTASDICNICKEDKGGISRILSDLEASGLIFYDHTGDGRRYRAKAYLTEEGMQHGERVSTLIDEAVLAGGLGLTDEERTIFYKTLYQIADNLDNICNLLEKEG